jgi:cytochrome c5
MKAPVFLLLGLWSLAGAAHAASGEEVVNGVCAVCHTTKFDKAPQLGDRKAWAPLLKGGQAMVTAHAWLGVRNMPPRGGKNDLPLEDFARGVAYMARQAGGDWPDPDEALLTKIRAELKGHRHDAHEHHK